MRTWEIDGDFSLRMEDAEQRTVEYRNTASNPILQLLRIIGYADGSFQLKVTSNDTDQAKTRLQEAILQADIFVERDKQLLYPFVGASHYYTLRFRTTTDEIYTRAMTCFIQLEPSLAQIQDDVLAQIELLAPTQDEGIESFFQQIDSSAAPRRVFNRNPIHRMIRPSASQDEPFETLESLMARMIRQQFPLPAQGLLGLGLQVVYHPRFVDHLPQEWLLPQLQSNRERDLLMIRHTPDNPHHGTSTSAPGATTDNAYARLPEDKEHFYCAIMNEIMTDPVIDPHTLNPEAVAWLSASDAEKSTMPRGNFHEAPRYDRKTLEKLIDSEGVGNSPNTRLLFTASQLIP